MDQTEYDNDIPLPFEVVGDVRVHLQGHEGVLDMTGTGARLTLHGTATFIEDVG